ncbi:SCO family protein [Fibrella aquatilis]|uniref:SCO family protein n=1 Tax=Fibrella aquatilis TaxID=2817059 RepID=A0A939GBX3_9BACT|nr:SCO family protein [Fibrella aquatilis]MBO0934409.1 SCO family protein [Fibrella aquatilis]
MSGILSRRFTSLAVLLLAGLLACQQQQKTEQKATLVPYYNTPDFTPLWPTESTVDQVITHRINEFSFRDQTNAVVTRQTLAGKVHVANFFFTSCPTVCPKMTSLLRMVQDTFRHEPRVVLLSFSVTPWLDSVPRLRQYAHAKGVNDAQWHLLTGNRGAIYTLARQSYFAEEAIGFTRDSTEFLHTEHLVLVDPTRRIRGIYNGTQPQEIDHLIVDIRALLESN